MEWTTSNVKRLKALYKKAVENEDESFIFDGQEILVSYAKYLIEYLTLHSPEKKSE